MLHRMFLWCLKRAWELDDWLYTDPNTDETTPKEPERG